MKKISKNINLSVRPERSRRVLMNGLFVIICLLFPTITKPYTNKTYMRPLESSFYIPEKNTFMDFISKQNGRPELRSTIDLSVFYFQSRDEDKLGRYFGVNEKNNISLSAVGNEMDVYLKYLVHDAEDDNPANIIFDPKTIYSGVAVSMIYDFSDFLNNTYFKVHVPFVKTENNLRTQFLGDDRFRGYLTGEFDQATIQYKLEKAKLTDRQDKTGVSDIDLSFVYKLYSKKKLKSFLGANLTIPVGNKPNGEFIFEPIIGNNGHFGLGISNQSIIDIYQRDEFELGFFFDLDYKYLIENTQKRTLSIKGTNWGQYYLLGKNGVRAALTPAANLLTRDVKVAPGSSFSADMRFLLSFEHTYAKFGYKFMFAQEEQIKLKKDFIQDTYGIPMTAFNPAAAAFGADRLLVNQYFLNNKTIDTSAASNPAILSNQVYLQIGYDYRSEVSDFVASFDLGGSYIFASENSGLTGWALWAKTEFSFF